MQRLQKLFARKQKNILNIYLTAGFPKLEDTVDLVLALEQAGADLVELGMPYSDPLADGETIQLSSSTALSNGMNLELIFAQVRKIRTQSEVPIILMGYLNQLLQYGVDNFLSVCQESGVDGLIIPDLPMDIYESDYKEKFEKYQQGMSFLVTPQTSDERISRADALSSSFLYVVSSASITGGSSSISAEQVAYFRRLDALKLKAPRLIGFGIHDKETFDTACLHGQGAIIGSAFIRAVSNAENPKLSASQFVKSILGK